MLSQALSGAPIGRQAGLQIPPTDIDQTNAAQQPEVLAQAPAQELVQGFVENQIEELAEEQTEEQIAEQKTSWLAKLKGGLAKTGQSLGSLFIGVRVDEDLFEEL